MQRKNTRDRAEKGNNPQNKNKKRKRARRNIPLIFVICAVGVVLFYSHIRVNMIRQDISRKQAELAQMQEVFNESSDNLSALAEQRHYMKTDEFIKHVARTEYGLLENGEIRFEIRDVEQLFTRLNETMPDWLKQRVEKRRLEREGAR